LQGTFYTGDSLFPPPAGGGSIDGTAVFIPSYLNNPYLTVTVYYPPGEIVAHISITPGSFLTVKLPFLQTPGKNLCTFYIYDDTIQIAVHRLTVYLFLPALYAVFKYFSREYMHGVLYRSLFTVRKHLSCFDVYIFRVVYYIVIRRKKFCRLKQ
jgi:hypothetical protein